MALTDTQKNKVVQLLGYGGKTLQVGSVIYNQIIADRLNSLPTDTEAFVVEWLAQETAIETQIKAAIARRAADKVGDITTNREELKELRTERRKISRELARHLDIPYQGISANIGVYV